MKYPYTLFYGNLKVWPVVNIKGEPLLIELDPDMITQLMSLDGDSVKINDWFDKRIKESGCTWAIGSYLENREGILSQYAQMSTDKRYFHLGIDICAPAGTPVFAPIDAVVHETGFEEGVGNYGAYVILKHSPKDSEVFYTMYGHMKKSTLPEKGAFIQGGSVIAEIGDLHENGGWNHHTHIQVITEKGAELGYFFKGYCSEKDLAEIENLCPNPTAMLSAGFCF